MSRLVPWLGPLLLALLLAWSWSELEFDGVPEAASQLDTAYVAQTELAGVEEIVEIPSVNLQPLLARPLFEPGRRPRQIEEADPTIQELAVSVPDPAPEVRSLPEPLPELTARLHGIFTDGGARAALVSVDGSEPIWRRVGETVSGWAIVEINENTVQFERDNVLQTLELFR